MKPLLGHGMWSPQPVHNDIFKLVNDSAHITFPQVVYHFCYRTYEVWRNPTYTENQVRGAIWKLIYEEKLEIDGNNKLMIV